MVKLSETARKTAGVTDFPDTIDAATRHAILNGGDLSALTEAQRDAYCEARAKDLGLNPFGGPIQCMPTTSQEQNPVTNKWEKKHKVIAYATKGATDQLRTIHNVKIVRADVNLTADMATVTVEGVLPNGRNDVEIGAVALADFGGVPLSPAQRANAVMKAMTKAKRRLTLSIIGAGLPDESELDPMTDGRDPTTNTPSGPPVTAADVLVVSPNAPTAEPPTLVATSPAEPPSEVNTVTSPEPSGAVALEPDPAVPPTTVTDVCVEVDALYLQAIKRVDRAALKADVDQKTAGSPRSAWSLDTAYQVRNLLLHVRDTGHLDATPAAS